MDFPALSRFPALPLEPDGIIDDDILRSPPQDGLLHARRRSLRARKHWGLSYLLQVDDLVEFREFEALVGTFDAFNWTHPVEAIPYVVCLAAPARYIYSTQGWWSVAFVLKEAG